MVARSRLDIALYIHCLSSLKWIPGYTSKCGSRLILLGTLQYDVRYALGPLSTLVVTLTLNLKNSRHIFHITIVYFVINFIEGYRLIITIWSPISLYRNKTFGFEEEIKCFVTLKLNLNNI